ncbi:hypothetical protein [Longimicrobium sp.]|uniref:hypothetical protein n=1 Tax=Longimicrobium sp. TaxID=2029185 RepID=UPI002CC061B1|nr:hypothetical protein [Longimicrobium sp.]HSU14931.1 hypothetical protein [Longimicrobium sp.]
MPAPARADAREARPARPASGVSATLLLPHGRLARAPLPEWGRRSAALLTRAAGAPEPRARSREVAVAANQVALIAAHQGRGEVARALCEAQMEWQLRLARRAGDPAIAAQALQPWVNLGRLEALAGDWAGALVRFSGLLAHRAARPVPVGGACVSGEGWEEVAADAVGFGEFLEGVYVIDSLKALLQNRRDAEALGFAAALPEGIAPAIARFGVEASVVAWCRAGECGRACDAALAAARACDGWERAVFLLRLAEALLLSGDAATARAVLSGSAAAIGRDPAAGRGALKALYVVHGYAGACREAGLEGDALSLARLLLQGGRDARDEVFAVDALRLLTALAPAPERARWAGEMEALQESSLYPRCRRGRGAAPADPGLDALYEQLQDVLSD